MFTMKIHKILISCFLLFCTLPVQVMGQCAQQEDKLIYPFSFAPSEGLVNKLEKDCRKEICLNGFWDFQPIALPSSYVYGKGVAPDLPLPEENKWSHVQIKIPSPWNVNAFANRNLEGPDHRNYPSYPQEWDNVKMAWMKKTVTIPADWDGQQIQLYFEAVAGAADVYINREKVGENFDLFLPFRLDITDKIKAGEIVEIWVGVRSQSLFEDNSTVGRRVIPAGSMWGYHIAGIWQDVYLLALPKVHVEDVFVKPLVSKGVLEMEVTLRNNTAKPQKLQLQGDVSPWINLAGTELNLAPVPDWKLGEKVLSLSPLQVNLPANTSKKVVLQASVTDELDFWTPEHPHLYALLIALKKGAQVIDLKYERFGWREWTISGTTHCLNGKPYPLRGDSWHFMGIPQMTRRYAWAWFTAIKGMYGNAVRFHAQVYPRFYLDVADEMGICVLDETAIWASDGGPKLDSPLFWETSKEHLSRLVLRDRNHAAVFGWSISNENKPVILYVFNKPELMVPQKKAWKEWRDIVKSLDGTRPWISSDGEDDGDGILPVTVGHYGDAHSMKHWIGIGKPWGIGEHSMAYYGTPEQVSRYNGERAYESQLGRMEGLANECYHLIADQRKMGASYSTVFNMVWYALKPLPLGKKNVTMKPDVDRDGVFFTTYKEGIPGVQPERIGPYSTTLNPGYDPNLPLFDSWPLYDAMRAANAPMQAAWSAYAEVGKEVTGLSENTSGKAYKEVVFIGGKDAELKKMMDAQGVEFAAEITAPKQAICLVDGSSVLSAKNRERLIRCTAKGADVWIWGLRPETVEEYDKILPLPVRLEGLKRSSFLPVQKSWTRGLRNSDFYFCELQQTDVSSYVLSGSLVEEGEVLLNACRTDWRAWNKRPEEIKTAGVLRSEYECRASTPVFVKYQKGSSCFYVSTLNDFTGSEKGYNTLKRLLRNAGIPCREMDVRTQADFELRDGQLLFPKMAKDRLTQTSGGWAWNIYVFSPRPLNDLLIEPNMPKLTLKIKAGRCQLAIDGHVIQPVEQKGNETVYRELPLLQGWNKLSLQIGEKDKDDFGGAFSCENNPGFLSLLKIRINE